jgi:hypothetical protein
MGIIIQLALTAIAFLRGWRWYALIPIAVAVCLGIIVGTLGLHTSNPGITVAGDLLSMLVLAIMCIWVSPKIKAKNVAITEAVEKAKQDFDKKG